MVLTPVRLKKQGKEVHENATASDVNIVFYWERRIEDSLRIKRLLECDGVGRRPFPPERRAE
jgi:hypothetical protein